MHKSLNLLHLVNVLTWLFLADIHFIVLLPLEILPIRLLQGHVDVVDHDPVLDLDVILKGDREVSLL